MAGRTCPSGTVRDGGRCVKNKYSGIMDYHYSLAVSFLIFVFLSIPHFHDWGNQTSIKLHFCSHLACMVYSLIFLGLAALAWDRKRPYFNLSLIVLIVGAVLMNITSCDTYGNMRLGGASSPGFSSYPTTTLTPACEFNCAVPSPPCVETDAGRDYITFGSIASGAGVSDLCMGSDLLRERYCDTLNTYTSVDISCSSSYGLGWVCVSGECRYSPYSTTTTTTIIMASTTTTVMYAMPSTTSTTLAQEQASPTEDSSSLCHDGLDNDGDGNTDCLDSGCSSFCECEHDGVFPSCSGYCGSGACSPMYTENSGWCACMPSGWTPCHDSYPEQGLYCDGWCEGSMHCITDGVDCYCNSFPCLETDDGFYPENPGACVGDGVEMTDYCQDQSILIEYSCSGEGCVPNTIDCGTLYGGAGYYCQFSKDGAYCAAGQP